MTVEKSFVRGDSVRTTKEDPEVTETYTEEGRKKRKWGIEGKIGSFSDSHGASYEIIHVDGTRGYYGPTEFEAT